MLVEYLIQDGNYYSSADGDQYQVPAYHDPFMAVEVRKSGKHATGDGLFGNARRYQ